MIREVFALKRLWRFSLILLVIYILPVVALAHPGRTDSKGGHTDRSTGDYHFHHGYSAHDHYDMDGDGDVDCPYDFKNATSSNSSSRQSSSKTSSSSIVSSTQTAKSTGTATKSESVKVTTDNKTSGERVVRVPAWVMLVGGAVAFIFVSKLLFENSALKDTERGLRRTLEVEEGKHQKAIQALEASYKQTIYKNHRVHEYELSDLKKSLEEANRKLIVIQKDKEDLQKELHAVITKVQTGTKYFPTVCNTADQLYRVEIPKDVRFIDNGIPIKGRTSKSRPFGDFTAYTTDKSAVYHANSYCGSSYDLETVHVFSVVETKRACKKCGRSLPTSIPEWYQEVQQLND